MVHAKRSIEALSRLVFSGSTDDFDRPADNLDALLVDVQYVAAMGSVEWTEFVRLADAHHVKVRALAVLEKAAAENHLPQVAENCAAALADERARIEHAVAELKTVCDTLESPQYPLVVIKSLDHWPDLGSDLDLYTTAGEEYVRSTMEKKLNAKAVERSWGDRLAHKWNFAVPGLEELVEIHVQYLGQTGEHKRLARRVVARRVVKTLDGLTFHVPAPEERIMISTLQRMYRHFYFRLCDMLDFARLLHTGSVDFAELKRAAEDGGIWPGVSAFVLLVAKYVESYGRHVDLPDEIVASARAPKKEVWFQNGFLRVSKVSAAGLYGSQLLRAGLRRDLRAVCRLPLLPPLAISALLAYRLTGSDKGVW